MGQLGFQEIIVIFMIALLVFGPRKLPELGKSLGKGLREFRKATNDLKSSWEEQVRDVDNDVKETRRDFSKIGRDVQNTIHQNKKPAGQGDRKDGTKDAAKDTKADDPAKKEAAPESAAPTGSGSPGSGSSPDQTPKPTNEPSAAPSAASESDSTTEKPAEKTS